MPNSLLGRENMPSRIGYNASYNDFVNGVLLPTLTRTGQNMRDWHNSFELRIDPSTGKLSVTVSGYGPFINIYPENKKAQGTVGTLAPGDIGRVTLTIFKTNLPRTQFSFTVHHNGNFNANALIEKLISLMPIINSVRDTPSAPSPEELLAEETKKLQAQKNMVEAASKRALTWEALGEVLTKQGIAAESFKEDECFNLKRKDGVTLKLEVQNGGIKLKDIEFPELFTLDEITAVLTQFNNGEKF